MCDSVLAMPGRGRSRGTWKMLPQEPLQKPGSLAQISTENPQVTIFTSKSDKEVQGVIGEFQQLSGYQDAWALAPVQCTVGAKRAQDQLPCPSATGPDPLDCFSDFDHDNCSSEVTSLSESAHRLDLYPEQGQMIHEIETELAPDKHRLYFVIRHQKFTPLYHHPELLNTDFFYYQPASLTPNIGTWDTTANINIQFGTGALKFAEANFQHRLELAVQLHGGNWTGLAGGIEPACLPGDEAKILAGLELLPISLWQNSAYCSRFSSSIPQQFWNYHADGYEAVYNVLWKWLNGPILKAVPRTSHERFLEEVCDQMASIAKAKNQFDRDEVPFTLEEHIAESLLYWLDTVPWIEDSGKISKQLHEFLPKVQPPRYKSLSVWRPPEQQIADQYIQNPPMWMKTVSGKPKRQNRGHGRVRMVPPEEENIRGREAIISWKYQQHERKMQDEGKRKEDPLLAYVDPVTGPVHVTQEAHDHYSGLTPPTLFEMDCTGQVDSTIKLALPSVRNATPLELELLLNNPPKATTCNISNLGELDGVDLNHLPKLPGLWFSAISKTICESLQGASAHPSVAGTISSRFCARVAENALILSGEQLPHTAAPQLIHPSLTRSPIQSEEHIDRRAPWVQMMKRPALEGLSHFGPEEYMFNSLKYMLNFTVCDPDFRLFSKFERIPVIPLLNDSLDDRESDAYSRLWRMIFANRGHDPNNTHNLIFKRVSTLRQVSYMVADLWQYGRGPPSMQLPAQYIFDRRDETDLQYIFSLDFEFFELNAFWAENMPFKLTTVDSHKPWFQMACKPLQDWLAFIPADVKQRKFISHIIIGCFLGTVWVLDYLAVAEDATKQHQLPPISQRFPNTGSLETASMYPSGQEWQQFLDFMQHFRVLFLGWGIGQDKEVLQNTLGLAMIDKRSDRQFGIGDLLHGQVQVADVQLAAGGTHYPDVAGYDFGKGPLECPRLINLANCAVTVLNMGITPRACAGILQNAKFKHKFNGGHTDPEVLTYLEQAPERRYLQFAPTRSDVKRKHEEQAMERCGLNVWKEGKRQATLTPNRLCMEAIYEWLAKDGPHKNYIIHIRGCAYNLKGSVQQLKASMTPRHGCLWPIINILWPFYQFMRSPLAQIQLAPECGRQDHRVVADLLCMCYPFEEHRQMWSPWKFGQPRQLQRARVDCEAELFYMYKRSYEYYAQDGVLIWIAAEGMATQIPDHKKEIRFHEGYYNKDLFISALTLIRDYYLKPIWSAKKLKVDALIEPKEEQYAKLHAMANKILQTFSTHCQTVAQHAGISLTHAKICSNILIVCWQEFQEAASLYSDMIREVLKNLPDPDLIGACQLGILRQLYHQILIYDVFLGGLSGAAGEAKRRLLPILHKQLFKAAAKQEAKQIPGAHVQDKGPIPKGLSLQAMIAEQRPGNHVACYLPGPVVHTAARQRLPNTYESWIIMPDGNPMVQSVHAINRKSSSIKSKQKAEKKPEELPIVEVYVPEESQQIQILPDPRLAEAAHEKMPAAIRAVKLAVLDRREQRRKRQTSRKQYCSNDGSDLDSEEELPSDCDTEEMDEAGLRMPNYICFDPDGPTFKVVSVGKDNPHANTVAGSHTYQLEKKMEKEYEGTPQE